MVILRICLIISLFIPALASAEIEDYPSTEPMPEIPIGAHLEGDIIVWDSAEDQENTGGAPGGNYWPSGTVPYIFASNVSSTNQTRAINAMQLWENVTNVNFRPWQGGDMAFLLIQDASSNSSFVGPQGGPQVVNITNWNFPRIIAHELAHALGVHHEQSRMDREIYVTINFDNISSSCGNNGDEDCSYNFDMELSAFDLYSPYDYDYDSIMHYGPTALSTGGNTITTLAPFNSQNINFVNQDIGPNGQCFTRNVPSGGWQTGIGQLNHLSHWDCRMMSFIYPQNNWGFLLPSRASSNSIFQIGIFSFPWKFIDDALAGTPAGGTLWIDGGTYIPPTINQAITILAPKGTVILN